MGNKTKLSGEIIKEFPEHLIYIEFFFGAGGLFFNKPKVKYNIVNDLDGDVFNLFNVALHRKEELCEKFRQMPIHIDLLEYWKANKETEPIERALRFLFLSNLTFMGAGQTIKFGTENPKNSVYNNIEKTVELLHDVQFLNNDFRDVLGKIQIREKDKTFIYCDPPYLGTNDNYSDSFTEKDSFDLFEVLTDSGIKFAMSEFAHPFIIKEAERRNLNIITIGERRNLLKRDTEILITNYENRQQKLFL